MTTPPGPHRSIARSPGPRQGPEERSAERGLPDLREFLDEVAAAEPGWSDKHGGPQGVAELAKELQEVVKRQAELLGVVRSSAIAEMLRTRSLADVAASLGISKQAASKAARGQIWQDPTW